MTERATKTLSVKEKRNNVLRSQRAFHLTCNIITKYDKGWGKPKPFDIARSDNGREILIRSKAGLPKELFDDMASAGYHFRNRVQLLASGRNKSLFIPWLIFELKKK